MGTIQQNIGLRRISSTPPATRATPTRPESARRFRAAPPPHKPQLLTSFLIRRKRLAKKLLLGREGSVRIDTACSHVIAPGSHPAWPEPPKSLFQPLDVQREETREFRSRLLRTDQYFLRSQYPELLSLSPDERPIEGSFASPPFSPGNRPISGTTRQALPSCPPYDQPIPDNISPVVPSPSLIQCPFETTSHGGSLSPPTSEEPTGATGT